MSSSSASPWKSLRRSVGDFFALRHTPGTLTTNMIASPISVCTILVACTVFGPELGLISMLGAMTALWESGRPFWARIRNSLLVSATLTVSLAVGTLIAPYSWAHLPATVLIIAIASVLYYAFMLTRGPTPVMLFYAALLGTFFGADQQVGRQVLGVTAFAAFLTALFVLLPLLFGPFRPERRAIAHAARAADSYATAAGTDEQELRYRRDAAHLALQQATLTLQSAWPAGKGARHRKLCAELDAVGRRIAATTLGLPCTPAATAYDTPPLPTRPSWKYLLSHALRADSVEWFTAWRLALSAGIAGVIGTVAGLGHPYWAILTATVVISQWMDRRTATRRQPPSGSRTASPSPPFATTTW